MGYGTVDETLDKGEGGVGAEDMLRAAFNILEDFTVEKASMEATQRATFNILDDFNEEKEEILAGQRAVLNILEDLSEERAALEDAQRATYNILSDFAEEREEIRAIQTATLNILEDLHDEKRKVDAAREELKANLDQLRAAEERNRQLTEKLERHTRQLETSNRELESFSYSVSHDLRAPLRHISGFIELLENSAGTGLDEQSRHYLTVIRTSGAKMGDLIDKLLSYSRMGKLDLKLATIDMDRLADEVIRRLETDAAGREIIWIVHPLAPVEADRTMLELVIQNLVGNAIKYTRGRKPARIEIDCRHEGGMNVYSVGDNGAGFDMQYVGKLFGVFQRLHSEDDFEGSGIGLANVRRIVTRHGGTTWAIGELDRGATFYFTLPAIKSESIGEPKNPAEKEV